MKKTEVTQLTGLRAIAAWWVVSFHSGYMLEPLSSRLFRFTRGGYLGVDVFFVLSGFVIAYNYMENPLRKGWERWREFYWMRFARLYPVHVFTLLVSLMFFLATKVAVLHTRKDFSGWTGGSFVANIFMVHAWFPHVHDSWNNASWSVSSEWFAYLLFPLIVYVGVSRMSPRFGVIAATLAATVPAVIGFTYNNVPFFPLIEVLFEFAAGCMIYVSFNGLKDHAALRSIAGGCLLVGIVAWVVLNASTLVIWERWMVSLFPLLVMYLAVSTGIVRRVMCSRPLVYWGKVSYSLYMTHNVTLWVLKYLLPEHHNRMDAGRFGIYVVAMASVAALTYHFVEEPARKWLRAFGSKLTAAPEPVFA